MTQRKRTQMIIEFDMLEDRGREPVADQIEDMIGSLFPDSNPSVTWTKESSEEWAKTN